MNDICDRNCNQCIDRVVEDLAAFDDPEERLEYLVDLAKDVPCLKPDFKKECFKVQGCLSNLWIVPEMKDGRCYFHCDCDAMIPKGIAFVLAALHSGYTPQEILELDLTSIKELGLEKFLSPNRRNSISHVSETIKRYARKFLEDLNGAKCSSCLRCLVEGTERHHEHTEESKSILKKRA